MPHIKLPGLAFEVCYSSVGDIVFDFIASCCHLLQHLPLHHV